MNATNYQKLRKSIGSLNYERVNDNLRLTAKEQLIRQGILESTLRTLQADEGLHMTMADVHNRLSAMFTFIGKKVDPNLVKKL